VVFLKGIVRLIDGLNDKIGSIIRWFTLIMVLLGAFNALARYATRYIGVSLSSNGYLDLQWYLFSLIFLLGAAHGLKHNHHVRVDVFYSRMDKVSQAWIDLIGSSLMLLPFSVLMLWVSWSPVIISWQIREVSPDPGGLPRYPIKSVILVSFLLLLLQGVSQIIKNIQFIRTHRQNRPVEDIS
tara:strand:- start:1142 stop:1690 length:549 start_codon:yes stop_codon:yes gene_type:complete